MNEHHRYETHVTPEQIERVVVAVEGIAAALTVIAVAIEREDNIDLGSPAEPAQDPLRTFDSA